MDNGEMELKKDVMWEGDERQWCTTVYSAWTEKEKVDCMMRQLKTRKQSHVKHVSFANGIRQERIRVSQLNKHTVVTSQSQVN